MGRKRLPTQCDFGNHKMFEAMGGDSICQACGAREEREPVPAIPPTMEADAYRREFVNVVHECSGTKRPFTSAHISAMVGPVPSGVDVEELMMSPRVAKTGRIVDGLTEWVGI